MWMYLLLAAGLFMGWSLGTNDAANAFGTAVGSRVIKYRTAVTVIAVMVMVGAIVGGAGNIGKLATIATNNKVTASADEVDAAVAAGQLETIKLKSALKAAIIFASGALTVFIMSTLKFPVSANQSITGAVIGWGLCHANYSDPAVFQTNLAEIGEFASTWLINPVGAAIISFAMVWFVKTFLEKRILSLKHYDSMVKIGYLIAGAVASYSIGQNSSASVTAFYFDATGQGANLLTSAQLTAIIGGAAICLGVLTYSRPVMETVGTSIADITQVDGFVVILAMSATVILMGKLMGIPVSTSQSVVGAVIGAGLVRNPKSVNFKVFGRIGIAWVSSPLAAGLMAYLVALLTKGYFG